jgi:serine/threonine protein kinase
MLSQYLGALVDDLLNDEPSSSSPETLSRPLTVRVREFSFQQLRDATDGWAHQIGSGGYGDVFRGEIDGKKVAVKRSRVPNSSKGRYRAHKILQGEMVTMGLVHKNICRLIGHCLEIEDDTEVPTVHASHPQESPDKKPMQPTSMPVGVAKSITHEQGRKDWVSQTEIITHLLVYELCGRGDLFDCLACKGPDGSITPALTARQRIGITLGICRGLEYLHVQATPPIIHGDIKSPNILLTEELVPKIAGTYRDAFSSPKKKENQIKSHW